MTAFTDGAAARRTARVAGLLYLGTFIGGFVDMYFGGNLIVSGDAAATAARIAAAEPLYRLGVVGNLFGFLCYVGVTALLYDLLAPVSRTISRMAAFFSLTGCAIGGAAAASMMVPLQILHNAPYLAAFTPGQLQAMAMMAVRLHNAGYNVAMTCFGVYCSLLGYLMFRSAYFPRTLGVLLALAGASHLIRALLVFLAPSLADALFPVFMVPGVLGEGGLMVWLLAFGLNAPKWESRALAAA